MTTYHTRILPVITADLFPPSGMITVRQGCLISPTLEIGIQNGACTLAKACLRRGLFSGVETQLSTGDLGFV